MKNPFKKHNQEKDYKDLYKTILEIGKSKVNNGLSYNNLIEKLDEQGFKIDDCSKLAVKKFFCDNFFHISNHRKPEPTPKNIERYHKDCNFVMKGEACLYLERLIELEQLKKSGCVNFWIAISAIVTGLIGAFFGNYPDWKEYLSPKKYEKQSLETCTNQDTHTSKGTHPQISVKKVPLMDSIQCNLPSNHTSQMPPNQLPKTSKTPKTIDSVSLKQKTFHK